MFFKEIVERLQTIRIHKQGETSLSFRAMRLFGGFLMLMLVCTFLSRAIDSLGTAKVSTEFPEQKVIEHRVEAEGQVVSKQEKIVFTQENLLVESVFVKMGAKVKADDILFTVSLTDLEKKIEEANLEIQKLTLEHEDYVKQREAERAKWELDLKRAREDYQKAKENGEKDVKEAKEALMQAQQKLAEFYEDRANQTKDEQQFENEGAENEGMEAEKETEETLLANVREKEKAAGEAEQLMEEAMDAASRTIEDLNMPEAPDSALQMNEIELGQRKKELGALQDLYNKKGMVLAQTDGIVTKVSVTPGEQTGSVACCLADESAGYRFVAHISKEQADYVEAGMEASIRKSQGDSPIEGLVVESIRADEEDETQFEVTIDMPKAQLDIGVKATMTVTKKSQAYSCCVPLQAVRSNAQSEYVLMIQKQETILGEEYTLRAVNVEILEKNEHYAALAESGISNAQAIVIDSDRAVEEGSKVRLNR